MSNTQFDNHSPISNKKNQPQTGLETHGDTLQGPGSGVYRSSHTAGIPSGAAKPTNTFGDGHTPFAPDSGNSHFNDRSTAQFGTSPMLGQPGHVAPSAGANIDPGPFAVDQTGGLPGAPTDTSSKAQRDVLTGQVDHDRHHGGIPTSKAQGDLTSSTFGDRHQTGVPHSKPFDSKGVDTDRQFQTGNITGTGDGHGSSGRDHGTTDKNTFGTHEDKKLGSDRFDDRHQSGVPHSKAFDSKGGDKDRQFPTGTAAADHHGPLGRETGAGHTATGHFDNNKGTATTNADHFGANTTKKTGDHHPHDPTNTGRTAGGEHQGTKPGVGDKIAGKTEKVMGKIAGNPTLQERGEMKAQGLTKN